MIDKALSDFAGTTWTIDPAHSEATFGVRHSGLARVHGTVPITSGQIKVGSTLETTEVTATLDPAGLTTQNKDRDNHLRSKDFFDIAQYPTWTFSSTAIAVNGDLATSHEITMTGDLTIHGVTKPVTLDVEFVGTATANGQERAGFSASGELSRKDFDLTWNAPIEAGGVLVGDRVKLTLDVAFVKD